MTDVVSDVYNFIRYSMGPVSEKLISPDSKALKFLIEQGCVEELVTEKAWYVEKSYQLKGDELDEEQLEALGDLYALSPGLERTESAA